MIRYRKDILANISLLETANLSARVKFTQVLESFYFQCTLVHVTRNVTRTVTRTLIFFVPSIIFNKRSSMLTILTYDTCDTPEVVIFPVNPIPPRTLIFFQFSGNLSS